MLKNLLYCLTIAIAFSSSAFSQELTVDIEEEQKGNRLFFHAINKNLVDLDVAITVEGTGIRQRKGAARKVRVPATSKVNLLSVIIERGQTPKYTYTLDVSKELSRRVIIRESKKIKIDPNRPITIYLPDNCRNCDSLIGPLDASPYKYKSYVISESEGVQKQLEKTFASSSRPLAEIDNAIIALGGKMYLYIETYEEMMEKVNEADEMKN